MKTNSTKEGGTPATVNVKLESDEKNGVKQQQQHQQDGEEVNKR
jgi:hypothetical protein